MLTKTPNKGRKEQQRNRTQVQATKAEPKQGHKRAKKQIML
jgi:hypothetical protein